MSESEKVSSPSAALPDVRALIERVVREEITGWWNDGPRKTWREDFERPDDRHAWFVDLEKAITRALEAALRSREGERVFCACGDEITAGWEGHRPLCATCAEREGERAEPADAEAEARRRFPHWEWGTQAQRYDDFVAGAMWAAAQRATPSAPTPNDEKRAALADPSGLQETR